MLYSKNGSYPYPFNDGTEGWISVPYPPACPPGKEIIWWYPPGWVIRDPKPEDTETTTWSWSQSQEQWVEVQKLINNAENTDIYISGPEIDLNSGSAGPV